MPSWLADTPLAHRGLHGDGRPENSLSAFAAAVEAGYGVELDVRLTRDGMPVISHDADLGPATGVPGRVAELSASEVLGRWLRGTDEPVPTLPRALGTVAGRVPVMVEVKSFRMAPGRLEGVVAGILDAYSGAVCVAAFNPRSLGWFRRHRAGVPRVLASGTLRGYPVPPGLRRRLVELRDVDEVAPAAVSYELAGLPAPATERWREAGGTLLAWTVTDGEELARARDLADNVIFEHVRP